ncbi:MULTISPECIES: ATP-binding protein [unclassified Herbaspirillum]|uniref:ATP-binding protein n=1 Tax=unclassified Herbaspirillum TaxID=2624150 RepID=UPI000E2E509D|nr:MULTISPECIES: ATP-binding protein [unclassified Herbaspirillum]RFB73132.1 HAMP domain-containing protein [Herbaspirillum sp. 3R-3a1]TFI11059.1 HAMP domain-containing protein [Herbaspirillum sp. 3R11]TFI16966.1 HAMP domain-containing protein [Herbaspirillum sp. 3R-11]TFI30964.1 HAMP domain-containing protein [Herbaspirillum sp. 3C11]
MTIRLRITLLVILTFIAISAIGGYAVFQSRSSAVEVKSVTEGVVPSVLASSDLVGQLKDVQLAAMVMVAEADAQLVIQENEKLAAKKATLEKALEFQAGQAASQAQKGLIEQAKESLDNYFGAIDSTAKFKLAGKDALAQASFFGNVVQYQAELEGVVDTLRIEKNRSKDSAIAALNQNLASTTTTISAVTAVAVIALALIGFLLYRQITGPISRMQTMMTEIAASQDFTRRLPVDRMDEVGHSIVAFNGMVEKIEEASALVKQKTADMQAMLQNIPQGILTVVDGNKVHPEYSAFLETVFETTDIAGRDLMDLVFAGTTLGADTLSQIEAIGGACIGEDIMNFEFNEHLMVGEVEKKMADGRVKILDLSWSPITDDADTVIRLMLCVRDVTELRKLAAEANEQKHELEMIGEILAVAAPKFEDFIATSRRFLDENEQIVHQNPEATAFAIAKLFRNMHTIKGNGRTYGLLHLSNVVHDVEQHYDDLRHPETGAVWEQERLVQDLARVRVAIDRYARINEVTLGRQAAPEQAAAVERHILTIDRKHIQESLHRLETVNTANLHELVAVRNAVRKTLRLLGTEPLADILASVTDSLPALASELGKAAPVVAIEDNGYVIHAHASALLQNVFMHLIRNAMDHGLETPDERQAKGKNETGTIRLQLGVMSNMLHMALSDDGRGLALAHIRRTAVDKQLIASDTVLSDAELARLIMRAGFSTRSEVTDVSGRGVGMDAVLDFVTQEHGRIEIEFLDHAEGADFRPFQINVLLPENIAVEVDGIDVAYPLPDVDQTAPAGILAASGDPQVA